MLQIFPQRFIADIHVSTIDAPRQQDGVGVEDIFPQFFVRTAGFHFVVEVVLFVDLDFLIGAVIIQVRSDHDGCVVQVQTDEGINAAHFQLGFGIAEPFAGLAVPLDLCSIEDDVGMRGIVFRGPFPGVAAAKTAHAVDFILFVEHTEHILKRRE